MTVPIIGAYYKGMSVPIIVDDFIGGNCPGATVHIIQDDCPSIVVDDWPYLGVTGCNCPYYIG